jgi:hypothetical protein
MKNNLDESKNMESRIEKKQSDQQKKQSFYYIIKQN